MKAQIPLPNPPDDYSRKFMFDLCSIVVKNSQASARIDQDNVFDKGSLILKSPDGSYFQITVNNSGTLAATAVTTVNSLPVTTTNPYT